MNSPVDDDLDGLYLSEGQHVHPDDQAAIEKLGLPPNAATPLHGTYTRFFYHRVLSRALNSVPNGILDIFDEDGNFAHFEWNETVKWGAAKNKVGAWELCNEIGPHIINPPTDLMPDAKVIQLWPNLSLARGNPAELPHHGASADLPFPLPLKPFPVHPYWRDMQRQGRLPKAPRYKQGNYPYQYLCLDDGKLRWVLPGKVPAERLELTFEKLKPLERCDDARLCGREEWQGQFIHYLPQWSLPLVGWNARLDEDFQRAIYSNLSRLYSGDPPDWRGFVNDYGTHYVNALTYGAQTLMETRYSLKSEVYAWQQGVDVSVKLGGNIDGAKIGAEAGGSDKWETKVGGSVGETYTRKWGVGAHGNPAAILFDLRPLWELFNPVFFPPNLTSSANRYQAAAPFIWFELRNSFRNYLQENKQLNQPLDEPLYKDYTPRFVEVQPHLKFKTGGQKRNVIIEVEYVKEPSVVELKPLDRQHLPPFLPIEADGSIPAVYRPYASFASLARIPKDKAGIPKIKDVQAGTFKVGVKDMQDGRKAIWEFPFSLEEPWAADGPLQSGLGLSVKFELKPATRALAEGA